ncbi:FxsB family cyclophane-forming radical SAM/SPASM peptide maturase [Phytohabitans suffuscus]|uniref:Radical SAM protein n=1 Tax=Phytohabitans suffuscus TaxID=624315 RepID=A0A6F8YPD0_9ACTN|nr:FxsB family cyclophane-forming radical SAM/SPASM peptide maturase [Phytohabitans suffuscus]BCB87980.1 radical SAM protein [Phytohabitans suffuscus]
MRPQRAFGQPGRPGPTDDPPAAPIRQILLKIHSRCNLSCDHCYMYQHADQTWRHRPLVMSKRTLDHTAARIAEHAADHDLSSVSVVLHGGEPLLAGAHTLDYAVRAIRRAVRGRTAVRFGLQTNGLLLDDRFLDLFVQHEVTVGVSLDGPSGANDRHRRYADGRGSHGGVVPALHLLRSERYRHLYGGILCTVDLDNDPEDVYAHLLEFEPPEVDLLLPHGNWTKPPPGRVDDPAAAPYAGWLIAVFDRWYEAPERQTRIRLFESIIALLLGGRSGTEAVGLGRIDLVTIETDGAIEQGDALKTTEEGMAATGLHVARDSIDRALGHPGIQSRQRGLAGLCTTCRRCPAVAVCGGGLYAHRYRVDNGFDNPSVYCADLFALIRHVAGRVSADLERARAS